jgi:hypothetical protein
VSERALAISFFDPAREIYGTARSGTTILFDGRHPVPHPDGPSIEQENGHWRAELAGVLELELAPVAEPAALGGELTAEICRVSGTAGGREVNGLGTVAETHSPPRWEELDALRSVSALVDENNGFLAFARRPRGALGHGQERVTAQLLQDGRLMAVDETRISTVYDSGGRQRSVGLELWLPDEELPHRGSGIVIAGSSIELEGLRVHTAVFRWRLDGREGIGAYELMVRTEPLAAA